MPISAAGICTVLLLLSFFTIQNNQTVSASMSPRPDGQMIAFTSDRDGNREIYVMNAADGSNVTKLTNDTATDDKPSWSPGNYQNTSATDAYYAKALVDKGLALYNLRRYQEAIGYYDAALYIDPNYFPALNNKGLALDGLGYYQDAISYYDKALAIEPNDSKTLSNKGDVLSELGYYQDAISYYDKALAIEPNNVDALNNKGLALYNLGYYQDAISYYDKALAIEPDYFTARVNKSMAQAALQDRGSGDNIL